MRRWTRLGLVVLSFASLGSIFWVIALAAQSSLFKLQDVQISHVGAHDFSDEDIIKLGKIQLDGGGLMSLDLPQIEKNLLSSEWIRDVRLKKIYPHTLKIDLTYRVPVAYLQLKKGRLRYIDSNGNVFGSVNLLTERNLPFVTGIQQEDTDKIKEALSCLELWDHSDLSKTVIIAGLDWDLPRGFRALVVYGKGTEFQKFRSLVEFGNSIDVVQLTNKLENLGKVFGYLSKNYLSKNNLTHRASKISYISIDQNKKIVVKIPYAS